MVDRPDVQLVGQFHLDCQLGPYPEIRSDFESAQQNNGDQIVVGSNIPGGTNNQNGKFDFLDTGNPAGTGLGIANAALGLFNSYGEIGQRAYTLLRSNALEAFAQDTWKVSRTLTLEIGVRYSYYQPWHAKWNDIANFDPHFYDRSKRAIIDPAGGFIVSGDPYNGVVLPGTGFPSSARGRIAAERVPGVDRLFHGLPEGLVNSYTNAFAPRFGVAYRLGSKSAVRAGAGVYHHRTLFFSSYLFGNPPNQAAVGVTNGQADSPAGVGVRRDFPFQLRALDPNYRYPTAYTYSLSVQRELPGAILLDLGYVGKNSINLRRDRNTNQLFAGTVQAFPGRNPDSLRPYEGLGIITQGEMTGRSNYQSFQLSLDRRFGNGLGFGLSYTFSKNIDNVKASYNAYNTSVLRSLADFDRPHLLNLNFIYQLPFGRSGQGVYGKALGGWQLSGVVFFRSGAPLSVVDANDIAGVGPGSASQPWNVVGNPGSTGDRGLGLAWFNTSAFGRPAPGVFGNAGLNILRGPSFRSSDLALFKNIKFAERLSAQVRLEAFNFLNHPVLGDPALDPRSGSFGIISSKSSERNLQLGLKLMF